MLYVLNRLNCGFTYLSLVNEYFTRLGLEDFIGNTAGGKQAGGNLIPLVGTVITAMVAGDVAIGLAVHDDLTRRGISIVNPLYEAQSDVTRERMENNYKILKVAKSFFASAPPFDFKEK